LYQDVKSLRFAKAECSAQIDDAETCLEQGGRQFRRNSCGVARNAEPALLEVMASTERGRSGASPQRGTGEKVREAFRAVRFANVEDRGLKRGVGAEESAPARDAIAGDAYNRDLAGFLISPGLRSFSGGIRGFLVGRDDQYGVVARNGSTSSGILAPSTAAARGCAPLGGVFKTRRFSAAGYREKFAEGAGERGRGAGSSGKAVAGL